MATVTLTPLVVVKNVGKVITPASQTAIDPAKDFFVSYPKDNKLAIIVNNTTAAAKKVTVAAGEFCAAGQGALETSLAQDAVTMFVLGSDRFKKNDGTVQINFEAGMTGFVEAVALP